MKRTGRDVAAEFYGDNEVHQNQPRMPKAVGRGWLVGFRNLVDRHECEVRDWRYFRWLYCHTMLNAGRIDD